ncbi:NADPH-dependent FMN reductase [Bowmanella pacifica]|uniref:FMN reductase n=1 Tax=Bowmanella pacifica TaxID=502051 RepID=A0A917YX38_9ALTE|nr:NAD(P)H-dependent oxidoreductase [Bowmanella pacifica]GGO67842.1 FMN reductase [Bowmanella pacifica]
MSEKLNIAVIMGSTREGRLCESVTQWLMAELATFNEFALSLIDPKDLEGQTDDFFELVMKGIRTELGAADAFIVVTPEYNHSFPAPLKQLIDAVNTEWHTKPVGFVSYGGISGGLRAVEQLRQIFVELQSASVRDSVSFINAWEQFDAQGTLREQERPRRTLIKMLEQLNWWGRALKQARHTDVHRRKLSQGGSALRLACQTG